MKISRRDGSRAEILCRVSSIMETLAEATGVGVPDQLLMCAGARLDAGKSLAVYGLPSPTSGGSQDVFLYNKSVLRSDGHELAVEAFKPLRTDGASAERDDAQVETHALDTASSPLTRALPQYARQFAQHLQAGQAGVQALKQRHEDCLALVSEMEVQSRAIDSAQASVETHFTHVHSQIASFQQQYRVQHAAHGEVLAGFEQELQALEAASLHPAVCSQTRTRLADLVDPPRLREWHASCQACHQSLAQKVSNVEELFASLRVDVEAIFMQAPTVQLEALATQLDAMQPHLGELGSIVQVLERDDAKIRRLVRAAQEELGGRGGRGGAVTPLDTCQLMETMHDSHATHLVPQIQHYRAIFERFYRRCLDDKNQMTRDVSAHLQRISSQQMKMQTIRNKLAIFREAAAREDDMFAQLLVIRRVPAAYRQCLAECMRRQAFGELYASQARQMAERMGRLREKELAVREAFLRQVQAYLPLNTLDGLGLVQQPPHCQISLPAAQAVPHVSLADLQKAPMFADPSASAASVLPFGAGAAVGARPPRSPAGQGGADESDGETAAAEPLEVENARLRADLAARIAEECMRSLGDISAAKGLAHSSSSLSGSQRLSLESESNASARGQSGTSPRVPSPAASKFRAAISAQGELVQQLEHQLAQARDQSAKYETRIHMLEERLSHQAATLCDRSAANAASSQHGRPEARDTKQCEASSSAHGPAPLALTPVIASPTRSFSPVGHAQPDPGVSAAHKQPVLSSELRASGDPLLEAVSSSLAAQQHAEREAESLSGAAVQPQLLEHGSRTSDASGMIESPGDAPERVDQGAALQTLSGAVHPAVAAVQPSSDEAARGVSDHGLVHLSLAEDPPGTLRVSLRPSQ